MQSRSFAYGTIRFLVCLSAICGLSKAPALPSAAGGGKRADQSRAGAQRSVSASQIAMFFSHLLQ